MAKRGEKLSKETRKKMSDVRKGTTNAGSFKKGERRSKKTEFKKGQIPHNKGVKYSDERKKKMSITQIKKWDKLGRQSKEERLRKESERMRERRKDPKFREEQRKRDRVRRSKPGVRDLENQLARERHAKNPEKHNKKSRDKYWKNPEKARDRVKNYRIRNADKINAKKLVTKIKVLIHYSKGKKISCCCCGFSEDDHNFYALDHIINKKAMGHTSYHKGAHLYNWAISHKFPKGLQTLCHNCNQAKSDTGICPHMKS